MYDLKGLRKEVGMTQGQMALLLKCGQTNISMQEKSNRNLTDEQMNILIEKFGDAVIRKYIICESDSENVEGRREFVQKGNDNYRLVPIIHIDSVGGMDSPNSINGEPQYLEGYVPFVNAQKGDIAVFQSGTSMIPTIPPGSIMQIRKVENWREYFGYGNIFVIELTDGRRITKEIRKYSKSPQDYVWCVSHNPEVEDEELPKSMIKSVWKVIKILTDKGW